MSRVLRKCRLVRGMFTKYEGQRFRRRVNVIYSTELLVFRHLRQRGGQCRVQEPPPEIWVGRLPRKVQTLVVKFCGVVAHKEGANSGLIFWEHEMGTHNGCPSRASDFGTGK